MKRSNMRSKDHLNCPSHCYVKACIVCAISLINQDSLRISASPHSFLMRHHCPVFITILLTCDAAWQSRDNSSQNVTFPDCGENVQPSTSPVRTRENIHSSCSEEAHGLLWMCRVWGVLLITPVPESRPSWLLTLVANQKPGLVSSDQWEDRSCSVHFSLSPPRPWVSEISSGNMRIYW